MSTGSLDPAEHGRLKHRLNELGRRYESLLERVALFPNSVNQRQLNEVRAELVGVEQHLREHER